MGSFYRIEPEVSGGLGPDAVLDHTLDPPTVTHLHYVVHDWLGDCIVTTDPVFLIVPETAARLQAAGFGKFRLADAQVTPHDQFQILNPGGHPPELRWLLVEGEPGVDGLGITEFEDLVVSEAVLELLRADGLNNAEVTEWQPE